MSGVTFVESGMTFGPFQKARLFRIEKSDVYETLSCKPRIAEFLLLKRAERNTDAVLIVEAKTDAPKDPDGSGFTEEIIHKMFNSLFMFLGIRLDRFAGSAKELPPSFSRTELSSFTVVFILVVKELQPDWADQLKLKLMKHFQQVRRSFRLSPDCFLVLNEDMARTYGLVS